MAMMMILSSCQHDERIDVPENNPVPEGYVEVDFRVNQSDIREVKVRSVDPDGQDINSMELFCFNSYGLFLATATAELTKDAATEGGHSTSGAYKALIPEETSIIHFVANQNEALYANESFVNQTEAQVLAAMEGASGMMIYWRRFAKENNGKDIKTQLSELTEGIKLIRNQAKVTINDWTAKWEGGSFTVTGYVVTNIHAFGTVAPFCPEHGFAIYEWPVTDGHYSVTLPENKAMMSDITDINTKSEDYIFEHENTLDNPVSVIIKGKHNGQTEDLYYRAMIMNDEGEMTPILRNHHYKLDIQGALSYGQPTFEEALNGPATNNVWVSVDSWVKEVADSEYKLTVTETSKVFNASKAGTAYAFAYTLKNADGTTTGITAPEISWLDGNNVGRNELVKNFDSDTGQGYISVTLLPDDPDTSEQTGTLMIRKGRLYRTIDISMISTLKFTPSWVSAQVYGGVGENVTLKFTIPETCPESLFPFPVMVSVNDLDVRAASGMSLPVRLEGEAAWYGEPNGLGYKYEYIVDKPGVHRLYFHSLLTHGSNETEPITIEANHFEKLTKEVLFATHQRSIDVEGLNRHTQTEGDVFPDDEIVEYVLVPQKINAPVVFDLHLKENGGFVNAGANDEFMLYSKTLDYGEEADKALFDVADYDCTFYGVDASYWQISTNGRVMMFMPEDPEKTGDEVGHYKIYMKTNRPKSEDVVRISSNHSGSLSAHPDKDGQAYGGASYRSAIFELANNNPFRFAATVKGVGTGKTGAEEEVTEEVTWTYEPNQQVDISFDVTSFKGTDGKSVDPFGTEFEIYIDAPMLDIDESRLSSCSLNENKLKKGDDGRFVYTVDASRETERGYGTDDVVNVDATEGVSQLGERKTLPFKTNTITSAGDITISSDETKVVYFTKKFKVTNTLITGKIQYSAENGDLLNVPKDAFVAFVRTATNARIGSIVVGENGQYTLNLRKEYEFYWTNDPIEFNYRASDGQVYDCLIPSLEELFSRKDITLSPSQTKNN